MLREKAAAMPRSLLLLAAAITLLGHAALAGAPPRETITSEEIARQLQRELGDRLPSGRVELDLDNPSLRIAVPAGDPPAVGVDNVVYDARTGRVSADVTASADAADAEPVRVTGRVYRMIDMPVLTHPIAPGDVITARDVETIAVRSERLTQNFVGTEAELLGKTPRRSIRPGELVRPADLQVPIVIHKGELVTVVLQAPGMTLTAQAKALADGTQGSAIRVSNTRSGRMLEATVIGPGTVVISLNPTTAIAAR
jgi:flagella basal body P-ring formation protein FlgA